MASEQSQGEVMIANNMNELSTASPANYPLVFSESLPMIYQHNTSEILEVLMKQNTVTLNSIRNLMCAKVVDLFPELNGKRMVK